MKKIFLFSSILLAFALLFSSSTVFATNPGAVKNATATAQNAVTNVATGAATAVRTGANTTANVTKNVTAKATTNYNATRTATTAPVKFAGMTADGWTWFIIAALGICVIALVWYYGQERDHNTVKDLDK